MQGQDAGKGWWMGKGAPGKGFGGKGYPMPLYPMGPMGKGMMGKGQKGMMGRGMPGMMGKGKGMGPEKGGLKGAGKGWAAPKGGAPGKGWFGDPSAAPEAAAVDDDASKGAKGFKGKGAIKGKGGKKGGKGWLGPRPGGKGEKGGRGFYDDDAEGGADEWPKWDQRREGSRDRDYDRDRDRGRRDKDRSRWDRDDSRDRDRYRDRDRDRSLSIQSVEDPGERGERTDRGARPAADDPLSPPRRAKPPVDRRSRSHSPKSKPIDSMELEAPDSMGDFVTLEPSVKKRKESPAPEVKVEPKRRKVLRGPEAEDTGYNSLPFSAKTEPEDRRKQREGRFANYNRMIQAMNVASAVPQTRIFKPVTVASSDLDLKEIPPCEGLSQALEKSYLRLTTAPDPATVRPEGVLRQALTFVLSKFEAKGDPYYYLCDQLKAIRQDLTVQRINNKFTVEVYEIAAGFALQYGDQAEFNQSQANLKPLYSQGVMKTEDSVYEFLAYRLLYAVLNGAQDELNIELDELASLPPRHRKRPEIQHALKVVQCWIEGNYIRFNKLYDAAPNMGRKVMDLFRRKIADRFYPRLLKPYRPTPIPLDFVKGILFPGDKVYQSFITREDMWEEFVKRSQFVFTDATDRDLDTKLSLVNFTKMQEEICHNPGFL